MSQTAFKSPHAIRDWIRGTFLHDNAGKKNQGVVISAPMVRPSTAPLLRQVDLLGGPERSFMLLVPGSAEASIYQVQHGLLLGAYGLEFRDRGCWFQFFG